MPVIQSCSKTLQPFQFHGVIFTVKDGDSQAWGPCPFCGREDRKFSINVSTGLWGCKAAGCEDGNHYDFLTILHRYALDYTNDIDWGDLEADRGVAAHTIEAWGVVKSPLTEEWLVPGYSVEGKLQQLYRYAPLVTKKGKKHILIPTPGVWPEGEAQRLFGIHLLPPDYDTLYICEGPWDGMALWQALGAVKEGERERDGELVATSNPAVSLRARSGVVAVPGAGVFDRKWLTLCHGKHVIICYDNDHTRPHLKTGREVRGAGLGGTIKVAGMIEEVSASVSYLDWSGDGQQWTDALPDGYDVRDALRDESLGDYVARIQTLRDMITPAPATWLSSSSQGGKGPGRIVPKECVSWDELERAWCKAMEWTDGLNKSLAFMLASVISTETIGEQVWGIVMGPASCGKTTLAEALAIAPRYVKAVSTLTGLHSGYKSDKEGTEDHSMIAMIQGKTLIVKDGDTLLSNPNRDMILAQLRDLYDGTSRAHYRHGMNREYVDQRSTVLICGTGSMMTLDTSELGARFLICSVMRAIDETLERKANTKVLERAWRNVKLLANGRPETRLDRDMVVAKQLTGGYVEYLRENAQRILGRVEWTPEDGVLCIDLAEFVSFMRARESKKQDEVVEREFSSRLVEQHARLMACMTAVMGKRRVDDQVRYYVRQIALDTCQGRAFQLATYLYRAGPEGAEVGSLATWLAEPTSKVSALLLFLRKIEAVERFKAPAANGSYGQTRYRLTARLTRLYEVTAVRGYDS